MTRTSAERIALNIAIGIVAVFVVIGLLQPYFEAQAFNKLTGGHATYWDALWTELRVMGDGARP